MSSWRDDGRLLAPLTCSKGNHHDSIDEPCLATTITSDNLIATFRDFALRSGTEQLTLLTLRISEQRLVPQTGRTAIIYVQ